MHETSTSTVVTTTTITTSTNLPIHIPHVPDPFALLPREPRTSWQEIELFLTHPTQRVTVN